MLLQGLALAGLAVSDGAVGLAALAAVVLGVGTALVYPTLIAAISDAVSPVARAPAVGVYRFWRDMGYVAGGLLAGIARRRGRLRRRDRHRRWPHRAVRALGGGWPARDGSPPLPSAAPHNGEAVNALIVINDAPYGSERPYNALRVASALSARAEVELRVFLIGDGVGCAVAGQRLPDGHYHVDRMIRGLLNHEATVGCCGTCLDARGLAEEQLVEGPHRSTMEELADWIEWADRTLVF